MSTAIVSWERIAQIVYPSVKPINRSYYGVKLYQLNPQYPDPTPDDIPSMNVPDFEDISEVGPCSIPMQAIGEG